ncbi:hypothetical protein AC249_AIPGENE28661 [Exaiptasia diaphana]|nr:hypothetical protein AC249_AIPGENE9586 [Exaiptasia diaphana]KXJ06263.1 hypothetical protein AC249_AIPGENE28661 [Exaiptasia diaphana]
MFIIVPCGLHIHIFTLFYYRNLNIYFTPTCSQSGLVAQLGLLPELPPSKHYNFLSFLYRVYHSAMRSSYSYLYIILLPQP